MMIHLELLRQQFQARVSPGLRRGGLAVQGGGTVARRSACGERGSGEALSHVDVIAA